jgi:hypothetical protein
MPKSNDNHPVSSLSKYLIEERMPPSCLCRTVLCDEATDYEPQSFSKVNLMRAHSAVSLLALPALILVVLSANTTSATELAGCKTANGWDPRNQDCVMTVADGKRGDPFGRGGARKPAAVGGSVGPTGGGARKPGAVGGSVGPTGGGARKPEAVGGSVGPIGGGARKPETVGGSVGPIGGGARKPEAVGGSVGPTGGGARKPEAVGGSVGPTGGGARKPEAVGGSVGPTGGGARKPEAVGGSVGPISGGARKPPQDGR